MDRWPHQHCGESLAARGIGPVTLETRFGQMGRSMFSSGQQRAEAEMMMIIYKILNPCDPSKIPHDFLNSRFYSRLACPRHPFRRARPLNTQMTMQIRTFATLRRPHVVKLLPTYHMFS